MKIVGVQSSMRKNSNTLKLLRAALDGAREAGAEIELVELSKLEIEYCNGCTNCYRTGRCHMIDDYESLKHKLVIADGVILSSPNYLSNINAPLKAFMDRSANFIHEQYLEGKYGFSIMTADAGDEELLLNMMNAFLSRSGATVIGGVGHLMVRGPEGMKGAIERSRVMGRELADSVRTRREYPERAKEMAAWKEMFASVLRVNRDDWKHNYQHWVEMGWIEEH